MNTPPLYRSPLLWIGAVFIIFSVWAWANSWVRDTRRMIHHGSSETWVIGQREGRVFLRHLHIDHRAPAPGAEDDSSGDDPPAAFDFFHIQTFRYERGSSSYLRYYSLAWGFLIWLELALWGALLHWRYRRIAKALDATPSS